MDSNISEKEISFEQVSEGSLESDTDGQDQIETDADDEVKDGEDDEEIEVIVHTFPFPLQFKFSIFHFIKVFKILFHLKYILSNLKHW